MLITIYEYIFTLSLQLKPQEMPNQQKTSPSYQAEYSLKLVLTLFMLLPLHVTHLSNQIYFAN